MSKVFESVNMYDMFINRKVIRNSLVYCYMGYIYLYRIEDSLIFRGVDRDSDGYISLGRAVSFHKDDLEIGQLVPCDWHLYCYNYDPSNLLAFSNEGEIEDIFGRWADNIVPYDLNEILEVALEEESDGFAYPLEEIVVFKKENTYQISHSQLLQDYSNPLYDRRRHII